MDRAGESSFHCCQYSGTSNGRRGASSTSSPVRTNGLACCSGTIPHPSPATTASRYPSDVGTECRTGPAPLAASPVSDRTKRSWSSSFRSKTITGARLRSWAGAPARWPAAKSGLATGRYRARPSIRTLHPATGSGAEVTAAITWPSRSSAVVWDSSSRCSSMQTGGSCSTRAIAVRNQMARESAFTAIGSRTGPDPSAIPSSARASRSSRASCRAKRTTTSPDSVARTGFVRISSTRPVRCSSALTRWLTADGVTCRTAAAASKVPSSTAASSVRTWSRGSSSITSANGT